MKHIIILFSAAALLAASAKAMPHRSGGSSLVDGLVEPYLAIQEGLANDSLPAAQEGALAYIAAFSSASGSLDMDRMVGAAERIASASDLAAARQAMPQMTATTQSLLSLFGAAHHTPLALYSCPMAFSGKGASWIQEEGATANPYFGASMLRCGSLTKRLDAKNSNAAAPATHHAGCDHGVGEACSMHGNESAGCQMQCCQAE